MPAQTIPGSPTPIGWRDYLVAVLCLAAVLAVFFHKSFASDQILFSNDGPLGAIHSQAGHIWSSLLGVWQGSNWIGVQYPNTALDISGFLLATCCDTSPDFGSVLFAKIYAPTLGIADVASRVGHEFVRDFRVGHSIHPKPGGESRVVRFCRGSRSNGRLRRRCHS